MPLLVYCLLRAPTLLEPHWYTDEAGYAVTAWLATHGHTLYGTVWNNKPPLLFWTYGVLLAGFGPSEAALHAASALSGLLAVAVVHRILRRHQGAARALVGALVAAAVLGTPVLNGDLALPEAFLVGPAALGVLALLGADDRSDRRGWLGLTLCAGALFGVATLYQQTALDVIGASVVWLVVRRGRSAWPRLCVLLATVAGLVVAALIPYAISVGPGRLWFLLATTYGGYTATSLAPSLVNVGVRALELAALAAGAWLARRIAGWRLLIWLWAGCALIVATLPNRPYPHLGLPAVAPLAILIASLPRPAMPEWRRQVADRVGEALLLVAVLVPLGIGWSLLAPPGAFYSLQLTGAYYPAFIGRLDGTVSRAQLGALYNPWAAEQVVAARWLRRHHLAGSSAVVWSADAWVDLLTPLRPDLITPTIYMNEYWLGPEGVVARVARDRPRVVVADSYSLGVWPGIVPILHRSYREVFAVGTASVWLRRA